jgi:hypothetical protein
MSLNLEKLLAEIDTDDDSSHSESLPSTAIKGKRLRSKCKSLPPDNDDSSNSESLASPSPRKRNTLRRNCKSLPPEIQVQLIQNAIDFGGHDNFAEYCNKYVYTFGHTGSSKRHSVYNRRRKFIKLLETNPKELNELHQAYCDILGTTPLTIVSESIPLNEVSKNSVENCISTTSDCNDLDEGFELVPSFSQITKVSSSTDGAPSISKPISLKIQETMSDHPVYKVNLRHPEANPNGWMAFELKSVEYENELLDMIVLQKHFYDLLDINADGFCLTLSDCGTMVQVVEQSVPTFMGSHFRDTTLGLEANEAYKYIRQATNNAIELMLQDVNLNQNRQVKEYVLSFPDRIKLTVGKLNNASNRTLTGQLDITSVDVSNEVGEDAPCRLQHYTTMTYVIEVEAERRVLRGVKAGPVNALSAYMSRMKLPNK